MDFSKSKYFRMFSIMSLSVLAYSGIGLAFAQEQSILTQPAISPLVTFVTSASEAAPNILAAMVLLVIGFVAGKTAGRLVEKTIKKIIEKTNLQTTDNGVVEHTIGQFDSAHLITTTVKWFIYLFFVVAAINALQFEQLSTALTSLWIWIPNLLAFVLIIIVGSIIANYVTKWVNHEMVAHHYGGSKYIGVGVKVVIYGIVFAVALSQIGIGQSVIPTLVSAFSWSIAIAIGASLAVGLGLTLKEVMPGMFAGVANYRSVFKVGQTVEIDGIKGMITAVEMMHIIITNEKNQSVIIPTKMLVNKKITIHHTETTLEKSTVSVMV